ncbi:MAG: hypothetical protein B7C24_17105 [Bacteroidetes bacterium 4572_77]|nr:MAG: hypothetical protein B7C24_17105 [Bacteroidetes bacterium 4572_77]
MDLYLKVNHDTWSAKNKIEQTESNFSAADPSIDFNNEGEVLLSYCEFISPASTSQVGGIFISKSLDGGLTWQPAIKVMDIDDDPQKRALDRPWIRVDRSGGENDGNIYITSMNAKGEKIPPYNPYLHRSYDDGDTWESFKYLDTINYLVGNWIGQPMPTPDVSSDGTFHAIYPSFVYSQNHSAQYIHVSSIDGGNTLTHASAFTVEANTSGDSLSKKSYLLRVNPTNPQNLVFFHISTSYIDNDVLMRESNDGGINWAEEQRINDDPIGNNRMQDLVWAEFNQRGDLLVAWRDRRNSEDSTFTTASEIWGAVRWKDSLAFAENFKISDNLVPYDTILGASSGNDFMCVQFSNDTAYAVWGANATGALNIWFQKIILSGTEAVIEKAKNLNHSLIYPNPTSELVNILAQKNISSIELFDSNGALIETYYKNSFSVAHLSAGAYYMNIIYDDKSIEKRELIIKK